jgi:hypothetical protein
MLADHASEAACGPCWRFALEQHAPASDHRTVEQALASLNSINDLDDGNLFGGLRQPIARSHPAAGKAGGGERRAAGNEKI